MGKTKKPRFPNACRGIRKIYTGVILLLISALCFVGYYVLILTLTKEMQQTTAASLAALALVLLVIFLILIVVALIFYLVGLVQASKDEPKFKQAIIFMTVVLGLAFLSRFFNETLRPFLSIVAAVLGLLTSVFVLRGIISLADQLGEAAVAGKAHKLIVLMVAASCVSLLVSLLNRFAPMNSLATILRVLSIALACAAVVEVVLYLSLLSKTKKMLQ